MRSIANTSLADYRRVVRTQSAVCCAGEAGPLTLLFPGVRKDRGSGRYSSDSIARFKHEFRAIAG